MLLVALILTSGVIILSLFDLSVFSITSFSFVRKVAISFNIAKVKLAHKKPPILLAILKVF